MRFYTVRDLRTTPKEIWNNLACDGKAVITNNGKPTALMIDISNSNLEDALASLEQVEAMRAFNRIQIESARRGLDRLSEEDIEAETAAAREDMKAASCAACN